MAKIKFNNKNYNIDESAIAPATTELQSHLSTEMNGEGAKIIFGGAEYGIDSTKLSAEVADFIAHLATIAGNGIRVVVGGVEYNVDPSKVAGAMTELHTVFGSLHSDDSDTLAAGVYEPGAIALYQAGDRDGASAMKRASWDKLVDGGALTLTDGALSMGTGIIEVKIPDNLPELNEYGFYYGVCYGMIMEGMSITFVFNDDGSAVLTSGSEVMELPAGVIIYGDHTIDLSAMDVGIGVVSDDASMITFADAGMQFILGESVVFYGDLVLPTNGSVSSFSSLAFKSVNLTGIVISEGVSSISEKAFYDCHFLTDVILPNSLVSIGESAFGYCHNLTSIVIPENVTSISNYAFDYCDNLSSIDLPKNLVSIGEYAFSQTGLTSINLPEGLTSIGRQAFQHCNKLTSITIPGSVTYMSGTSFYSCLYLETVTFSEGITSVGGFYNCIRLLSVTIPSGVTEIGTSGFYNCSNLNNIILPDSLTTIGAEAFYDCKNLSSITFVGDISTWNAIDKSKNWHKNVPATYVQCSDGQAAL